MDVISATGRTMELSAAKRRLLEQRMRGLGGAATQDRIVARAAGAWTRASAEQSRIWVHAAMEPELPIYTESVTVHRYGRCDVGLLEASFQAVLDRHEAWRTSFRMEGGELLQVVAEGVRVRLGVTDLTGFADGDGEARRLAGVDAGVAFDLERGPLVRARVFRVAEDHHWLQLTLHHLIFDGVSIYRVFLPELAAVYAALEAGGGPPLGVADLQYGDYAAWQEGRLRSAEVEEHLVYWRGEFAGELPVLRLPVDRARTGGMSHRGAMECFTFPVELTERLHAVGRACGATLYMVLLAALKTLFFRYSGQEDVIVGGLADGRRRPELEGMMGCFLQTFALRTRPAGGMPFVDYLKQVRRAVLGALAAAEVPFDQVVQAVRPQRTGQEHPFFQTFLAVQPEVDGFPAGWGISKPEIDVGATKFDLYLEVEEQGGRLGGRLMYSTDLFDAATIRRMVGHWTTLLHGIAVMPECCLGDLPVMTREEQGTMLVEWNRTRRAISGETVDALVARQARETPDAVAVEFAADSWTYGELERRAVELAGRLQRAGAGPGGLVAVCLERSMDLPCALLAVMKTGAAYLPLDPGTPKARRALCLEGARPAVVLTQGSLVGDLPEGGGRMVLLEEEDLGGALGAVERGQGDAAYVIHTSGSTGRPKGVEISHQSLVNLLESMRQTPGLTAGDTLLAVTTISFDIAGLEMFLPLLAGGRVVVASRQVALDPYLLAEAIESSGCTVLQATPATWRGLLAIGWKGKAGLRVMCGGEALPRDLAEGLLGLGLEVWNVYGPTETTIWSTVARVRSGVGPVSVGRPIANTTAYVLDGRQQPVPVGVQGELWLGGAGLATGYRGQPEMTADRFVEHELLGGERLYRTGDYAVWRGDGTLDVQGRADNQVKVRGYRIELEDVEAALCAHPLVAVGAARVWPDAVGGSRLSGYVVGKGGTAPDAAEMREFLRTRVPEYMIPSDLTVLAAMPMTSNGKLDRKALRRPEMALERVVSTMPEAEDERALAAIWGELLGVESVGMEDNFFDLGGHSLLVARLQVRMATAFGRKLAMAAIFHAATLASQVALLRRVDDRVDGARLLALQPKGSRPHLFWIEPPPLIGNLVAGLGVDQPVLGVTVTVENLAELGGEPELGALAACYARTIVRAQPRGPYFLGGLCTSGLLAYEIAVQLVAAGQEVASVAMLDSENPVFYRRMDAPAVELAKVKFYAGRALRRREWRMFARHVRSRVMRLFGTGLTVATEMSAVENAVLQAALRYTPPVYAGDVLLVLPGDRPEVVDYRAGWQGFATGRFTCVDVDSHHDELLSAEHAGAVAGALLRHFDGVRGSPVGES